MKFKVISSKIKEELEKKLINLAVDMRLSNIEIKSNAFLGYYSTFIEDNLENSRSHSNKITEAYKKFFKKNGEFNRYAFLGKIFSISSLEVNSLHTFGISPESQNYITKKDGIYHKYKNSTLVKIAKNKLSTHLSLQRFILDHKN